MQGKNKYNKIYSMLENNKQAYKILSRVTGKISRVTGKISRLTKNKQAYRGYFTVINTKLPNDKYV